MGSLFLVRHATTRASEAGRNLGQRSDPPLTPEGHRLAARTGAAIAAELAALPHGAARIVTSPARRCRETAAALATALAVRAAGIQVEAGLWEIDYGAWEGMTQDQVRARDPELRAAYERDPYETRIPGGESGREVAERASGVLDALEQWLAADRGRAAVAVTHNHVVRLRLAALLGIPLSDYRRRIVADPGCYSLITFGPGEPVVRRVNAAPP